VIAGVVVAALLGVVTWTLLEYLIHRFMGHDRRFRRTPFGVEHTRHHVEGDYFAPTWKKLISAIVVTAVLAYPAIVAVGAAAGMAYLVGMMGFYLIYELQHRREHTHPGVGGYGRWIRRHHFRHHLVDARTNFGVTTPLWDLAFGTYRAPPAVMKVPPRLAMRWLLDARGAVRAEYADRYELGKKPQAEA
jgi:sterol desaturase/sphingolipid hydroxylase (fatty acid hydroxylase superfamily)